MSGRFLFYIVAVSVVAGMVISCSDEPRNPGDLSKKCELSLEGPAISLKTGHTFDIRVARETDTVYKYLHLVKDTVLDEDGMPVIGSDGYYITTVDSVYVYSKIKARLVELEPLYVPAAADTFSLNVNSNARWLALTPEYGPYDTKWYFNITATGGGDSRFDFRTTRNRQSLRVKWQEIITSDSSVMYRLPIAQYGEKDQPENF